MEYPTNKEANTPKPTDKETKTPQKDVAEVVIDLVFKEEAPAPQQEE